MIGRQNYRFGVYALFEKDGESEIGVLFPGKSFINSTMLLGDSVKTDQELGLLFPPGMPVYMDLASQVCIPGLSSCHYDPTTGVSSCSRVWDQSWSGLSGRVGGEGRGEEVQLGRSSVSGQELPNIYR